MRPSGVRRASPRPWSRRDSCAVRSNLSFTPYRNMGLTPELRSELHARVPSDED